MSAVLSFIAVLALVLVALAAAAAGLAPPFAVVVPYLAVGVFLVGISARVLRWSRSAVPFRIPTTAGQQRSLPWIRSARLDNPASGLGATGRMLLEVLTFRSLFRNTRAELRDDGRLVYSADKLLWAGALAFHWSFLVVLVRHYRYFIEPVPAAITALADLDGFFQVGVPIVYLTNLVLLAALAFLLFRRLADRRLRYISLPADYFPLFLLLGIGVTGVLLRYFVKTDITRVKELALSLVALSPKVPEGLSPLFLAHLLLVSVLFAYFPFSKLSHMAGVFLSPTRNLANTNRIERHVNPWDAPVEVHTYEEWEEEFHDKLVAAGIPLDRE